MLDSYCSRKYHDKGLTDDELIAWIHSIIGMTLSCARHAMMR